MASVEGWRCGDCGSTKAGLREMAPGLFRHERAHEPGCTVEIVEIDYQGEPFMKVSD